MYSVYGYGGGDIDRLQEMIIVNGVIEQCWIKH